MKTNKDVVCMTRLGMGLSFLALLVLPMTGWAVPFSETNKWAWAEHAGYLNFRATNAAVAAEYAATAHVDGENGYLTGWAWSEMLGWVLLGNTNGAGPYTNTDATNWGVNITGSLVGGFAWSESAGWINFAPTNATMTNRVTYTSANKRFEGYAWSEMVGWIRVRGSEENPLYALEITMPEVIPSSGILAGGYEVVLTNTSPAIGIGGDITNIVLGGVGTVNITGQGANWVRFIAPPASSAGLKDIVVQSASLGNTTFSNAFLYDNPALQVLGTNGVAIADGEDASSVKGTYFGYAFAGGDAMTNMLAMTNVCASEVEITGWEITGTGSAAFSCAGLPSSLSLGVGTSTNFTIVFSPPATGSYSASMEISGPFEPSPYRVNLTGFGMVTTAQFNASNTIIAVDADGNSSYPGSEIPAMCVDWQPATKYLNWGGPYSGFIARPIQNVPVVIRHIQIGTANDAPERDPASFELYGSWSPLTSADNSRGTNESWTLISSGTLSLPDGRNSYSDPVAVNSNRNAYTLFKLIFPTLKGVSTVMQISEVHLSGSLAPPNLTLLGTNGSAIANDAPASATTGGDFGLARLGATTLRTFALTNSGAEALNITGWVTNGGGADAFVVAGLPAQVAGRSVSNFTVSYQPASAGAKAASLILANNSGVSPFVFNLAGSVWQVAPSSGPFVGGNTILITNGHFGAITNVLLGGVAATLQNSGAQWAQITAPAIGSTGLKDIVIQTSDNGDTTLADAYTVNPAGQIGISYGPYGWTNLATGINNVAYALAHDGANLYVGGQFTTAGGQAVSRIAKWNGSTWTNLGSGMDSIVYALAHDGTNLYAGGQFTTAGGVAASRIAMWNGSTWTNLGSGMNNSVYALVHDGTNLYAGGQFGTAGGVTANRVAKWNGSSWTNLGTGMNNIIRALALDGENLYAAGEFTTAGGGTANRVAKWNGSSWTNLGTGITDNVVVWALAHDGTTLYAGGEFATAGGVSAKRIAQWNGANWSSLGSGMNDWNVYAIEHDGTKLYAGGDFTNAGGVTASRIAQWNGSSWTNLGSGMNNWRVRALTYEGATLYAGGEFTTAGGVAANYVAKWGQSISVSAGVVPNSGSVAGGYAVTISGANLGNGSDVTHVTLCGVAATNIASQSATQVVVWAGASASITGEVVVFSTSYGSSTKSAAFAYTGTSTRVVLYDFYLSKVNDQMQVCWQTAAEEKSVGFDLFRWDGTVWLKVNAALIPSQDPMGASYCVAVDTANAEDNFRYRLVEYETDGGVQEYGPFDVAASNPRLQNISVTTDGVVLRWLSRVQDTYAVQRTLNLTVPLATIATGLPATPPMNVYTDQVENAGPAFYRIRVE